MQIFGLFKHVCAIINDERSFEEKIQTGLILLLTYDGCTGDCFKLKKAVENITQDYYYIDVAHDVEAAKKMNKIKISLKTDYPIMFYQSKIYLDPMTAQDIDDAINVVKYREQ